MTDKDIRRYETFLRSRQFKQAEGAQFASNSYANELFTKLEGITTELDSHKNAQDSGLSTAQQGTESKAVARDELEQTLEAISRTAKAMSRAVPGIENKFRFSRELKDQELLTRARAIAADATPFLAEFVKRGLPADFLDDLNEDIEEFAAALNRREGGRETHVSATAAINDLIERGMDVLRELDAVMRNIFRSDPARLAAWLSASRVERAPRRKKSEPIVTPPQTS
jgi:hypothetical protein